jgi:hypothetical protein
MLGKWFNRLIDFQILADRQLVEVLELDTMENKILNFLMSKLQNYIELTHYEDRY